MLKGHVFSKQLFGNPIFALFINTFLDGKNGVSDNYKNGMAITYSGSNLTVGSGAVCIQGRFLEEDTSTTIAADTDTAFCKLVIEINLDKQNTESEFVQGAYKIVKNSSTYPTLTQTNIVKNNSGIYQYELARFKTSTSGISDFQDMRTFLDFDSIYSAIETEYRRILEQLRQELAEVEDGSAYVLNKIQKKTVKITKNSIDFWITFKRNGKQVSIEITMVIPDGEDTGSGLINLDEYIPDFAKTKAHVYDTYILDSSEHLSGPSLTVTDSNAIGFKEASKFGLTKRNPSNYLIGEYMVSYNYWFIESEGEKTLRHNLSYIVEDDNNETYLLGDVNGDGTIDSSDMEMIMWYIDGRIVLSTKQFKAADMNEDGVVDSKDYVRLMNQLGITD